MEVTEWEPEQAVAFVVRDANMEAHGRTTFEAVGPDRTVLTVVTISRGSMSQRWRSSPD
jgi:hypothetical protein